MNPTMILGIALILVCIIALVTCPWLYIVLGEVHRLRNAEKNHKDYPPKFYDDHARFLDQRLEVNKLMRQIVMMVTECNFVRSMSVEQALKLTKILDELNKHADKERESLESAFALVNYKKP